MRSKCSSKSLFIVAVPQTSGPYFLTTGTLQRSLPHMSVKLGCPISAVIFNQFSPSVISDSLRSHGMHNIRLTCLSPTPGACSNSCPLSRWCHPTISSSVVPFSSHFQSFPASGSVPVSQFFASGGQNTGASVSASVLPMSIQDRFPLG